MNARKKKTPGKRINKKTTKISYLWIIAVLILIPIGYGIYLYWQQTQTGKTTTDVVTGYAPSVKDALEIPRLLTPRDEQVIRHTGYTVSYNKTWRLPNWVGYEITRRETEGKEKRNNRFVPDPLVKGKIATNGDYTRSGYDKGHMAPAADMKWSATAMKESFYFSNICPQHPELNRRKWKDLEEKIRDWATADSAIIVICGPIVSPQPKTIGKNRVAVPSQFFKVILSPYARPIQAIGFLFKNEKSVRPLSTYVVTVDSIETLTGIDFFASLPDEIEKEVESNTDIHYWLN